MFFYPIPYIEEIYTMFSQKDEKEKKSLDSIANQIDKLVFGEYLDFLRQVNSIYQSIEEARDKNDSKEEQKLFDVYDKYLQKGQGILEKTLEKLQEEKLYDRTATRREFFIKVLNPQHSTQFFNSLVHPELNREDSGLPYTKKLPRNEVYRQNKEKWVKRTTIPFSKKYPKFRPTIFSKKTACSVIQRNMFGDVWSKGTAFLFDPKLTFHKEDYFTFEEAAYTSAKWNLGKDHALQDKFRKQHAHKTSTLGKITEKHQQLTQEERMPKVSEVLTSPSLVAVLGVVQIGDDYPLINVIRDHYNFVKLAEKRYPKFSSLWDNLPLYRSKPTVEDKSGLEKISIIEIIHCINQERKDIQDNKNMLDHYQTIAQTISLNRIEEKPKAHDFNELREIFNSVYLQFSAAELSLRELENKHQQHENSFFLFAKSKKEKGLSFENKIGDLKKEKNTKLNNLVKAANLFIEKYDLMQKIDLGSDLDKLTVAKYIIKFLPSFLEKNNSITGYEEFEKDLIATFKPSTLRQSGP